MPPLLPALIRWFADPFGAERRRLARIMAQPFPDDWLQSLRSLPFYRALPAADQERLRAQVLLFRHEKSFEGCGGQELDEHIMTTIAAHACLLTLHRPLPLYPALRSILVYPDAYFARYRDPSGGPIRRDRHAMLGTSWTSGTVILSWHAVDVGYRDPDDGHNVALHEFAHQLDQENGPVDGAPDLLPGASPTDRAHARREWARIFRDHFERLQIDLEQRQRTFLDPYGATAPEEFFAVATEAFFERPQRFRKFHPALFAQLQRYYDQDPTTWKWK